MMNELKLACQDEQRRHAVRRADFNGLDYLEVSDDQRHLTLFFLGQIPSDLTPDHFQISGGRRITGIQVVALELCDQPDPTLDDCLILTVDRPGDFSTYRLCVVELGDDGRATGQPYPNFDPRYACLDFSFKVNCPSDLDCHQPVVCPPEPVIEPEINYLAKDYASFRQLILDRLALLMPEWQERHVPDLGIALVELLAYTGDYLSYYQDAVATEAYLDTARRRISVRRHARLVDYHMHEGCNARAWLYLEVEGNPQLDPDDALFSTSLAESSALSSAILSWEEVRLIPADQFELFAPLLPPAPRRYQATWLPEYQRWLVAPADGPAAPIRLYENHNRIYFYTWGDQECCLPEGATSATLYDGRAVEVEPEIDVKQTARKKRSKEADEPPPKQIVYQRDLDNLHPGDFLLFEEVIGPKTGNPADADPTHRHVVRLTKVEQAVDELYQQPVLEIAWEEADALPFPLCISAAARPPDCQPLPNISVARGNIILVDHGRPTNDEDLGCVPLQTSEADCECGRLSDVQHIPGRFRPQLSRAPLLFSQPLPESSAAAGRLQQNPRQAAPAIRLLSIDDPFCANEQTDIAEVPAAVWLAQPDLLGSTADSLHFVAEVEEDGRATLRFGDGELGRQPAAHSRFLATYRTGSGPAGNVGAEAISHLVYRSKQVDGIRLVRNPLPAQGGLAPEPMHEVKLFAPHAFRQRLERAITADDYVAIVMRDFPQVQRAAARLRWTGGWYEVLVVVDAHGQAQADPLLLDAIASHLHRYRRIGHEVGVLPARQVSLEITLHICVRPNYLRGHVKGALLDRFSRRRQGNGRPGFFHPDNLTFGEGITLSSLVAAAQAVPGVESVTVKTLQRLDEPSRQAIAEGILPLGPLEVARLDNDPNVPENGRLTLELEGGR
ncbi:MAG TPA: putative baseplate assembly protein [Chloroflexota bacterium]|nr:putative baseplate assembly protein [Chloroflexota bacterium]